MIQTKFISRLGLSITVLVGSWTGVSAYAPYLKNFQEHYETNSIEIGSLVEEQSCGLCHVSQAGGGRRNAYGNAFKKITLGQSAGFAGLEFLDSDADGFNNLEEIFLQSHPGVAEDAPESRLSLEQEQDGLFIVIDAEADCERLEITAFGSQVSDQSSDFVSQSMDNPSMLTISDMPFPVRIKLSEINGTILAKCGDSVGSLSL